MKNLRTLLFYGLLIVAAVFAALQSRRPGSGSRVASVDNAGPLGFRALFLLLQEEGHNARAQRASLTELPAGAQTVVLAGPVAREVSEPEQVALQKFVEAGGTLVYLFPLEGSPQVALEHWLQIHPSAFRLPDPLSSRRVLQIWQPRGPFSGLQSLGSSMPRALRLDALGAVAVAGDADEAFVAFLPQGHGAVYVFSSPDVGQNRWLDTGDNLAFWEALAMQGPLVFDEWHHVPPPPPPVSPALWAVLAQIGLLVLAVFWARGVRLGPARPVLPERHRSTREYLSSFGWLLRRAQVERELLASLRLRVRHTLWEEAAISPHVSPEEASLQWARLTGQPAERFRYWERAVTEASEIPTTARTFAELSTEGAHLEHSLRAGRRSQ
jgi:hypothetical protein